MTWQIDDTLDGERLDQALTSLDKSYLALAHGIVARDEFETKIRFNPT